MSKVFLACLVDKGLKDQLARVAERNERSISGEVRLALKAHLRDTLSKMENQDGKGKRQPLRDN